MTTWEEVLELRQQIPPRHPRGDPRNKLRSGPGRRFGIALLDYEREHGIPWLGQPGRDYNQRKPHD